MRLQAPLSPRSRVLRRKESLLAGHIGAQAPDHRATLPAGPLPCVQEGLEARTIGPPIAIWRRLPPPSCTVPLANEPGSPYHSVVPWTPDTPTWIMRITELRIANFRCFREAELRMAPITLVTGANSAGKTSLFAPLLAAAQTDGTPAMLSPNGRHIQMGDFVDMVHRHQKAEDIRFGFDAAVGPDEVMSIDSTFDFNPQERTPQLKELSIRGAYFSIEVERRVAEYVASYEIRPEESEQFRRMRDDERLSGFREMLRITHNALTKAKEPGMAKDEDPPSPPEPTDALVVASSVRFAKPRYLNMSIVDPTASNINEMLARMTLSSQIEDLASFLLERVGHIDSFRLAPQRTYYESSRASVRISRYGANYVEQMSRWEAENSSEAAALRQNLKELSVLADFKIRRLRGGRLELAGRPKASAVMTNLTDLGFGTSQVLPVLVAINQLEPGSLFSVSQPETHLHPEVQALLANYFVRLTKDRNMSFIIETHSEYLINRLRLLVAKGEIGQEDLSAVYVTNSGTEAKVCPIELRSDGSIDGAPPDFFETYMMDVMNLALAE